MRQTDMLKAPIRSVFFSYLAPSVSATLVTSIYILADTMMIGRASGPPALRPSICCFPYTAHTMDSE